MRSRSSEAAGSVARARAPAVISGMTSAAATGALTGDDAGCGEDAASRGARGRVGLGSGTVSGTGVSTTRVCVIGSEIGTTGTGTAGTCTAATGSATATATATAEIGSATAISEIGSATATAADGETAIGVGVDGAGAGAGASLVILRLRSVSKGENAGFGGSGARGAGVGVGAVRCATGAWDLGAA